MIDVITDFDFEDGAELYKNALPMAQGLAGLKHSATKSGVPVIYVNDNRGKWQEDLDGQVKAIDSGSAKGKKILELLRPTKEDYYVLKHQRSGFYATPLSVLLFSLDVTTLVIAGLTTDICVLFTPHDAYMRGYKVKVPEDCSAAVKEGLSRRRHPVRRKGSEGGCEGIFGNKFQRASAHGCLNILSLLRGLKGRMLAGYVTCDTESMTSDHKLLIAHDFEISTIVR